MKKALLIKCSPRPRGVSDRLGDYFFQGLAGLQKSSLALRDYAINPCRNCGACEKAPWNCVLDAADQAAEIYERVFGADLVLFASPIYFYALPAHFKALIDRAQSFYQSPRRRCKSITFIAVLAAGRVKGEKLFSGALLTLRCFLRALGFELAEKYCLRGLESVDDLLARPEIAAEIVALAEGFSEKSAGAKAGADGF